VGNRLQSQWLTLPEKLTSTIREVAERAGVSVATVSRVFSGGTRVTENVSRRVREAARQLNYQPNRVARNLRVRQTQTVGLIVPDIENPFYTSVIGGIEEVLQASEYSLLLANSNENPKREQANARTLQAEGVAGIIFTPSGPDTAIYERLAAAGIPLVAVSRTPESMQIDAVCVANREGARTAIEHLIGLGHRRIAMISGPPWISTARDRLLGYEEALAAHGIASDRELVQYADFRQHGGYNSMRTLLSLQPQPTAVFVGSNLMTLGALQAIHERGLEIPRDIAVVGFDDMPWAVSLNPPLTAVAQPAYEVGETAARLLLERLRQPDRPPRKIVLETTLTVRRSCGAPAS
jgi:DNA-binding LacI/PurR family transcriptional regulator